MANTWVKIKFYTKVTLIALLALYGIIFLINNSQSVNLWFFWADSLRFENMPMWLVLLLSFAAGMLAAFLLRTTLGTLREFRTARDRGRTERLEREMNDMKRKAGRLRTSEPAEGK